MENNENFVEAHEVGRRHLGDQRKKLPSDGIDRGLSQAFRLFHARRLLNSSVKEGFLKISELEFDSVGAGCGRYEPSHQVLVDIGNSSTTEKTGPASLRGCRSLGKTILAPGSAASGGSSGPGLPVAPGTWGHRDRPTGPGTAAAVTVTVTVTDRDSGPAFPHDSDLRVTDSVADSDSPDTGRVGLPVPGTVAASGRRGPGKTQHGRPPLRRSRSVPVSRSPGPARCQ